MHATGPFILGSSSSAPIGIGVTLSLLVIIFMIAAIIVCVFAYTKKKRASVTNQTDRVDREYDLYSLDISSRSANNLTQSSGLASTTLLSPSPTAHPSAPQETPAPYPSGAVPPPQYSSVAQDKEGGKLDSSLLSQPPPAYPALGFNAVPAVSDTTIDNPSSAAN